MITTRTVSASDWQAATGWHLEDSGWCADDRCVAMTANPDGTFDTVALAAACQRATVIDETSDTLAVGPAFDSLADARLGKRVPDVVLTNRAGEQVRLASIVDAAVGRRRRIVIHAWAPW